MRIIITLIAICVFYAADAQQKFTEATPESQGFSTEKLQRIDNVMKEYIDQGKITGTAFLIARNGKIIYHRAVGYDDKEAKKGLKRDGIFRIASQTKAITSVGVMILYEEGKILLDEPVSKYIHAFKNPQVLDKFNEKDTTYTTLPAKREITIRDLLTHTSGIGYAQIGSKESNAIYAKNNITAGIGSLKTSLAEDIQKLGSLPLMHNPGEKFTYGLNTDVLGYLIEVVSGMTLDDFLKTKIFEPLGMTDTYFNVPPEKQDRIVNIYMPDSTHKLKKVSGIYNMNGSVNIDYPRGNSTYFSGGAGLSSTLYDYAIFMQMLLNGGEYNGRRIISRNTVRMMTTNQIGDLSLGDDKFGLGFALVSAKGSAKSPAPEGVFSWGGAFGTGYWIDPKEKIVALVYKQVWNDPAYESGEKFKVLVYSAMVD